MTLVALLVLWILVSFACGAIYAIAMYEEERSRLRREQRDREYHEWVRAAEEAGPDWAVIGGGIAGLYDEEGER